MVKKTANHKKSLKSSASNRSLTKSAPKQMGRPREWTEEDISIETEKLYEWIDNENNYFFTSFLNDRKLNPAHIDRFCRYSENFRKAFELAKQVQEQRLVELAVTRKGDPGFIKFILQNKAGWKEKSQLSGDANNPLAIILERIGQNDKSHLEMADLIDDHSNMIDYYED